MTFQARTKNAIDLTGQTFNQLTVIELAGRSKWQELMWRCRCECGGESIVRGMALRRLEVESCGCAMKVHGFSHLRLFSIWNGMRSRCFSPTVSGYKYYGARGITICKTWLDFKNFYNWSMKHGYQDDLTIDRKNNDGNYSPQNCRWTTIREQNRNNRNNRWLEYEGKLMLLTDWARVLNMTTQHLWLRLRNGQSLDQIIRYRRAKYPHQFQESI